MLEGGSIPCDAIDKTNDIGPSVVNKEVVDEGAGLEGPQGGNEIDVDGDIEDGCATQILQSTPKAQNVAHETNDEFFDAIHIEEDSNEEEEVHDGEDEIHDDFMDVHDMEVHNDEADVHDDEAEVHDDEEEEDDDDDEVHDDEAEVHDDEEDDEDEFLDALHSDANDEEVVEAIRKCRDDSSDSTSPNNDGCEICSDDLYEYSDEEDKDEEEYKFTVRADARTRSNVDVLAERHRNRIIANPHIQISELVRLTHLELGVTVSRDKCRLAKAKILKEMKETSIKEFAQLRGYAKELMRLSPKSNVQIDTKPATTLEGKPQFKGIYVCLEGSRKGFLLGCRPMIGVYACFLKGMCKGTFLEAVARDGNNQMFPIA
ncbi:hypothetical protein SLEP1_g9011 [Rubroshorea leprosula]|uniref:Transposase n=1 Tax=Rubroshorea leprosula TaxID=152421 RepID=A0AAV5I9L1_9ROSI|nr:hypothetical protein SLEP1_g9011 [Rubroshorea leprosula]